MSAPLEVGVTGGIGSGKSVVCTIFSALGIPVYDADLGARNLMATDGTLIRQIKDAFGDESYLPEGGINRAYLADLVFNHDEQREKLNGLVHPRVKEDYLIWRTKQKSPYLIREAALLYETGIYKDLNKMIVVTAPESLRMKRVLNRDSHRTKIDVEKIFRSQMPEEEKEKRADFIIVNDDRQMILPQVLQLHKQFVNGT